MSREVLQLVTELLGRDEPFALATVVWRRGPSSGKQGARAVILPDGKVLGWLGGACAEPTVVRAGLAALEDGQSRLMFLGPGEEMQAGHREGITLVPMACESEGAMEVYLEPMLPNTQVVVIGRSPAADTLARLAQGLGWAVAVVDDGGSSADHPGIDRVITSLDLSEIGVTERSFVVVATQGHYDEQALQAALATPAGYVGLVSSRKRASTVLEFLRGAGVTDEMLTRVRAPAGLDLGKVAHDEMAVAILAEMVAVKASGELARGVAVHMPEVVTDPVCGMDVDIAAAKYVTDHHDQKYYFCAAGCLRAFEANPESFLTGTK